MIIEIYSTYFRGWEFKSDELNSNNSLLNILKSFISYPNYFEFVDRIQFRSVNEASLYDAKTNNQFSEILLLDALISFGMKALIHLFTERLSLVIKHTAIQKNVDKIIKINDRWYITLLDKNQLYRNEMTFPNFDYIKKGFSKRSGKVININERKFETFRNMIPNIISLMDKNNGNFITKFIFVWIL